MPTLNQLLINLLSTPSKSEATNDSFLDQLMSVDHLNFLSNSLADKNNSIPSFRISPAFKNFPTKPDVGVVETFII